MILMLLIAGLSAGALLLGVMILRRAARDSELGVRPEALGIGAVANFFDTLGIGSFAPTIAWFRFRKMVPDKFIPLTMFIGYTIPAILQGVIFLAILGMQVDVWLLLGCIAALVTGGYLGVPIAAKSPVRLIQGIVGVALLVAAFFYVLSNLGMMPVGGTAASLPLPLALIAVAASFLFGILLSFGVGNYAPTLALLSLMGMDPRLAFPIMAASAGFGGVAAGVRCVNTVKLDWRIVLGLTVGAIPAVLVAAFIVKEMPLEMLRWLVAVVVTYAGITLLLAAARKADVVPEDADEALVTH